MKEIKGFFKNIKISEKLKEIKVSRKVPIYKQDPKGYFLIKINQKKQQIEVGYCTNKNILTKKITGKNPIGILNIIIQKKIISKKEHIAYLGIELHKAYIALKNNIKYIQDQELNLKK